MRDDLIFELRGREDAAFLSGAVWRFRRGEQWVIAGPNGAGKSYLAALLAGETPLRGIELTLAPDVVDRVALVSFAQQQERAASGWLQSRWHWHDPDTEISAQEFLSYKSVYGINPFEIREPERARRETFARRAQHLHGILELSPLLRLPIPQLSNGEMRRVLWARALLPGPALLVLDDPFAGLDIARRDHLKKTLDTLVRDGLSLALIVRHADEIPQCMTHILRLREGRITDKRCIKQSRESAETRIRGTRQNHGCPEGVGGKPVIEMRGVSVRYGQRTVLRDLDWLVRAGERWLVRGPNGSGKTTLLSLVTGDNPAAYAYDIKVFGQERRSGGVVWRVRRRIGEISPEMQCHLDLAMSVMDVALSGRFNSEGRLKRRTRPDMERAEQWLRLFDLHGLRHEELGALSAGQQRVVLLVRALVPNPELLLLDEPCLNLDERARRMVLSVLERLMRERRDLTLICVAHRPDHAPRGLTHTLHLASI